MFTSREKGGVGGIPLVQVLCNHGGVTPYRLFIQKHLTYAYTPRLKTGGGVLENWRTPARKLATYSNRDKDIVYRYRGPPENWWGVFLIRHMK
jgi:hypothetical protein